MKDDKCIIEIDGVRYAVDRTFDGSPAIYYEEVMWTYSREHISVRPPTPDDQLVILCHVVEEAD